MKGKIKDIAAFTCCLILIYSAGFYSALDDEFNNFAAKCQASGAVSYVIDGETHHVKCDTAKMSYRWVLDE